MGKYDSPQRWLPHFGILTTDYQTQALDRDTNKQGPHTATSSVPAQIS